MTSENGGALTLSSTASSKSEGRLSRPVNHPGKESVEGNRDGSKRRANGEGGAAETVKGSPKGGGKHRKRQKTEVSPISDSDCRKRRNDESMPDDASGTLLGAGKFAEYKAAREGKLDQGKSRRQDGVEMRPPSEIEASSDELWTVDHPTG